MSPKSDTVLSVRDLLTIFPVEEGTVRAVDGISFDLQAGETLGIVGESGSGKSVTALSIMQLVPKPGAVSAGSILYHSSEVGDMLDLTKMGPSEMQRIRGKRISMIFQEPMTSLNPLLRCGEQIAESMRLHLGLKGTELQDEVIHWLERVQLQDPSRIYQAYPHQLSGGQKQRVMIAMALCSRPDILIADEPTTALDVTVQRAILELIDELKKELGTAVIFITHDLGVISHIADRSLVMYQGKIVETGTIRELFSQPKHPYTQGLIACRPPLDHRLTRLPVITDFLNDIPDERSSTFKAVRISEEDSRRRLEQLRQQPPLLEVDHLRTWYAAKTNFWGKATAYVKAVEDVSFQVFPGETLGLVGESGCGKTTLGRSILRLVEPVSGAITYNEQSVMDADEDALKRLRKDMQIIFQDPYASLNPRMMVGSAIMEPMQVYGIGNNAAERKAKTLELLEQVGLLPEHFYRYPHEFSGGQRQRICIARALAVDPRFIVCDEPVSALDVSVQAQVLNLLQALREEHGLTYIFISHDLSVVKFMSDRILVMKDGGIVESGVADDIYRQPKEEYTKELIAAIL
ncbi:MAG: ABC transporter ATP-binding protein [Saprospiraceae bacterium]|nr:ABC transporter ATP-binding protein [Lewinella sp.]